MKAGIERRHALLVAGPDAQVPEPPEPTPLSFLQQMERWVREEVAHKVSSPTGRCLSQKFVSGHRRVYQEVKEFSEVLVFPLTFAGIDARFYAAFRNYILGEREQAPATFNHYVKVLRAFLTWADYEEVPVYRRSGDVLKPVEARIWVGVLTQAGRAARRGGHRFSEPGRACFCSRPLPRIR